MYNIKLEWSYDLILLIYDIPKNEVSWKSWPDPWFPRNSKSKWTLKWLPLNRGYFKFYFCKGKSILIILGRTYIRIRKSAIVLSHYSIAVHFVRDDLSCDSLLLIHNPPTRGNVETLVGSSVSPSPLVKMKFKLTVSQ